MDDDRQELLSQIFGDDHDDSLPTEDSGGTLLPSSSSGYVEDSYNEVHSAENNTNIASGENDTNIESGENNIDSSPVENNTSQNERLIAPGEVFDSIAELFEAYQEHARLRGFAVMRRTTKEKYFLMVCVRSGKPKNRLKSKKTDCKARLNGKIFDDGRCTILSMFSEHNHITDPTFSALMPAHRQLTVNLRRQLEANDRAGVRVCKNVRLCEVQSGGPENLGCTVKDCRNFIEKRRRLRLGEGDAEAIRSMFVRLQLKDPNFFYIMDIDSNGRLCNVLWIHPRSRAAYKEFHDVVSFDTTYLVNRYKMPFGSVVGVNHHSHSILLGCALMAHEDADTFKWIFKNWLEAMDDIHPNAIITDQCESIRKAIRELMPNTIHRFCIWHILSKLPIKFKGVSDYSACSKEFKGIVYESLDIATFESKWTTFLVKYSLTNNQWLRDLYRERESWVPVFLHHTFWAGMMSTQRSESMHAYFDEFFHSRSTLKQFMEQYDMAMSNKIQKEFSADFDSKNKSIKCITDFQWENQFQNQYTNSIFDQFQKEMQRMFYCHVVEVDHNVVGIQKFRVLERRNIQNNFYHRELTYTVEWRPNGSYISCNCRKFEFKGILCCHIMVILSRENIQTVHERYIVDRWKKTLHRPHSKIFFSGGYPHMTEEYKKYQEVEKYFQQCMDAAMGSVEKLAYVKESCSKIKDILVNWDQSSVVPETSGPTNTQNSNHSDAVPQPLLDPLVTNSKGRPHNNRRMSAVEAAIRTQKKRGRPPKSKGRGTTSQGRESLEDRANVGMHGRGLQLMDESEGSLYF